MFKYEKRRSIIGERIKKERKKLGLSKQELLLRIYKSEKSHKTLSAWEKGERIPDLDSLVRMAEVFNCDVGYLLGDYPEHNRTTSDICAETGLSEEAVSHLLLNTVYRPEYIELFNFLLANENFNKCLTFMYNYADALNEYNIFELARLKYIVPAKRISMDTVDLVSGQAEKLNTDVVLSEYQLSTCLQHIVQDIKKTIEDNFKNKFGEIYKSKSDG